LAWEAGVGARANGGAYDPAVRLDADLPFQAMSPSAARRLAGGLLAENGLEALYDDVALVTSELVTNAVRHGNSPLHVHVAVEATTVLIEVTDAGGVFDLEGSRRADESGRGLHIVGQIATSWGLHVRETGKVVWARISI
jgi:anti-sigma regulatory factor (Ser/Thr protein kinase)